MLVTDKQAMLIVAGVVGSAAVVSGQVLPCWATVDTGKTACTIWHDEVADPQPCWVDFPVNMTVYRAERSSTGWSTRIVHDAECSGQYKILDGAGGCTVLINLAWEVAGTKGSGDSCPSGPPG